MLPKEWFLLLKRKVSYFFLLHSEGFFFLTILLLIVGFFLFFKSDFFKVKEIDCQKDNFPCQKGSFLNEIRGQNIFLINTASLIKKIEEETLSTKDIKIKKQLPAKIILEIISREPLVALTLEKKAWFLIDEDGVVYNKIFTEPKDIPIIVISKELEIYVYVGQKISDDALIKVVSLVKELKRAFISFDYIILADKELVNVYLTGSITATFSTKKLISSQVDSLQFILRQSKIEGKIPEAIDLRFTKPVLKY